MNNNYIKAALKILKLKTSGFSVLQWTNAITTTGIENEKLENMEHNTLSHKVT